jgi:hypothetical protein
MRRPLGIKRQASLKPLSRTQLSSLNGDGGVGLRRYIDGEEIPGGAVLEQLMILFVVFAGGEWPSGVGADDIKWV